MPSAPGLTIEQKGLGATLENIERAAMNDNWKKLSDVIKAMKEGQRDE